MRNYKRYFKDYIFNISPTSVLKIWSLQLFKISAVVRTLPCVINHIIGDF
jgi:hypothetical protein